MSKIKFEYNSAGFIELMKSQEMQNIINDYGQQVVARANGENHGIFELETGVGTTRCHANIKPSNVRAYYGNLKYNILLKALGGGE